MKYIKLLIDHIALGLAVSACAGKSQDTEHGTRCLFAQAAHNQFGMSVRYSNWWQIRFKGGATLMLNNDERELMGYFDASTRARAEGNNEIADQYLNKVKAALPVELDCEWADGYSPSLFRRFLIWCRNP